MECGLELCIIRLRSQGSIHPFTIDDDACATPSTMALSPKWYQFLVGVFASLGSLLYGYDLGVIAQVIASQSFNLGFKPTDNET